MARCSAASIIRGRSTSKVVWSIDPVTRTTRKEPGATQASAGRIDILVNNAGGGVIRPFLEHTAETLRQTIDRNLWTVLW